MIQPTQIHQSIAQQVDHMKPEHLRPGIDVGMEPVDRTTLRILTYVRDPERRRAFDVSYDEGRDLYDVIAYPPGAAADPNTDVHTGVYCDMLGELLFGDDAEGWSLPFGGISTDGGKTWKEF